MSEVKRVRYFEYEFLDAADFEVEQEYHRSMRYKHNRDFHTWGIGHGLEVNLAEDQEAGEETKVTVNPGTAVDSEGREIVLPISKTIDFDQPGYEANKSYYVTIKWHEQPGPPAQQDELKRWEEIPDIDTSETFPEKPGITLVLVKVTLKNEKIIAAIDNSDRRYAAIELGDDTVSSSKIVKADGKTGQDTDQGEGIKTPHIQDGAVTTPKLADEAVTNAKLNNGSVDEDKLGAAVKGKLVTNGNSHNHSGGDGAQISHSSLNKDDGRNPHGTTAADVGALPVKGGSVNGNVAVNGSLQSKVLEFYGAGSDSGVPPHHYAIYREAGPESPPYPDLIIAYHTGIKIGGHWSYEGTRFYNDAPQNEGATEIMSVGKGDNNTRVNYNLIVHGNIGIRTMAPDATLHVKGIALFEGTSGTFSLYGGVEEREYNGYLQLLNSVRAASAWGLKAGGILVSDAYAYAYPGKNDLIVKGKVGIGTPNPGAKLEVVADSLTWGGWIEAIRLGSYYHAAITHPDGGLLFGFHKPNRSFYFGDMINGNYPVIIHADDAGGRLWAKRLTGTYGDYAEYFESKDGKEIEAGISVILDGGKIRPAKTSEAPMGIISASPGIVGGVHVEWPGKYLKDEFGKKIMEEYQEEIMVAKKEKVKKERQKVEKKKVKEKVKRTEVVEKKGKYYQVEVEENVEREIEELLFKEVDLYDGVSKKKIGKHRVPVMESYEEEIDVLDEDGQPVMVDSGKFETKTRPKLNPDYDETKEYIPREKRPEWNCVGLLGQLPLRKDQPTAPTWIKIKDISKDVELWLVK